MTNFTDLIIVGGGIAGLSAAIYAADAGLQVRVLIKDSDDTQSNSWWAQGGIVYTCEEDSPLRLESDILRTGGGINNKTVTKLVTEEGPQLIQKHLLDRVNFERNAQGEFDLTQEGGHSLRRILHAKDETGKIIQQSLLNQIAKSDRVQITYNSLVIDLITNSHHSLDPQQRYKKRQVLGVYILLDGEVQALFSSSVMLATGGIGSIYLHSTNPASATGDGIAMAYRAGCEIINAEYVQFHPTTLYHRDAERFLLTEALRGEGAHLLNRRGEYFMNRYNPELSDLAPRDEVARAIYAEMDNHSGFVYLDARKLKVDIKDRFPAIYKRCTELDINIYHEPVPVVPSAHYFCGGILTNRQAATTIQGLYAVGECACTGLHGANRLASMSLLEGLVFGIQAVNNMLQGPSKIDKKLLKTIPDWIHPQNITDFDPMLIAHDLRIIQTIMWDYVGIVRSEKRLNRALADLNYFSRRIELFYKEARATRNIIELRNVLLTSTIIARSAMANKESRGCHFRST